MNKKITEFISELCHSTTGESAGARTRDPNIKSVVLYLLSYGFSKYQSTRFWWCKDKQYFYFTKIVAQIITDITDIDKIFLTLIVIISKNIATFTLQKIRDYGPTKGGASA